MGRAAVAITLSASERRELDGLARRRKTAQGLARRARIVLAAADGLENKAIVEQMGADANTVGKWRRRFAEHRLDGLYDEPRSGAPRTIDDQRIAEIIGLTLEETPPDGTHWSLRSMARASGYAPSTIHRIWRAFGLQPHRSETFKLSADPLFVDKVRDIVGLYLDPPERALVLCVDEKSQIQALDRSRPLLPMRPGQVERRTHDYIRHGMHHALRGLGHRHRQGHRAVLPASPQPGVPQVPAHSRNPGPGRPRRPSGDGQLRHPQDPCRPTLAGPEFPLARPFHPDRRLLAQPGRALLRPADRETNPDAGSIGRRRNSNSAIRNYSTPSTPTRDPSDGPSPPTTSSPPSSASACDPRNRR